MKLSNRVLSMLLALALLFSLFPTVAKPTVVEAAVADTPAGVRNHLPSTAKDIVYLSDMTWEYSNNYQNKTTIKNGMWSNGAAIVIGDTTANGGTSFEKGLGVMPKGEDSSHLTASQTVVDLADNNYKQNFFYSAVGLTNRNADALTTGVVFEVWASYDKSVENYADADYVLLESSGKVSGKYVYQFHLDVSGARYLKLVVYTVGKINSLNSVWAGTCVYNNPGYYPKSDLMGLNNGQDNTTWVPTGTDRFHTYNFENLPADAVLLSSSTYKDASTYKGTSKMVDFKSASGHLGSGNHWLGGVADKITGTSGANLKDGIVLKDPSKYFRFNCRQPASSNNVTDGWVTFDISDLDVNRFYAVLGSGNGTAKHTAYSPSNGAYGGVKVQVWGAETKDGTYTLLSESEPIMLSQTGEFLVDITGVNFLKLRIQAKDTRIISSLDTLFYLPCVFNEWGVSATGATTAVQGTKVDYTAKIRHDFDADYSYSKAVAWAVEGAQKSGTKIENGKLTVDPAETATELKITASITEGGKTITSAPLTVAVSKAPVYTLQIQGPAEAGKNNEYDITATVTKDGAPTTYENITWTVSGNTDTATKIENGKLTIGNEPVGTKLTVKASFTEYGTSYVDTLEITVAAYSVKINGNTDMFPGSQTTLTADVLNEGQPVAGTVTWAVEGNGTMVANGNQAVITAKGTVGTIKVTATWTSPAGNPCVATHEIAVNAYTIDVDGVATAVSTGSTLPLTAVVKKNGERQDNVTVNWSIVNLTTGTVTTKSGTSVELPINDQVGSVLVITASAEFGGLTVSDTYTVKVTDYKLTIDPASVTVEQGSVAELTAELTKGTTPVADPVITWNVTKADGSAVSVSGSVLSVLADQPAGTELTVVAMAVVDGETILSAPAKITVVAPIVYKVTLNKTSASVKQGDSTTFTASVTKDGTAVSDPALIWNVTGGTKSGTAIDASGKLTVDSSEPVDTKLYVTASYTVGGQTVTSEAAVVTVTSAPKQNAFTIVTDGYESMPSNAIYLADDGVTWIESVNLNGAQAIRNGAWQNGAAIYIGGTSTSGGTNFTKGIGVQPQAPTATNNRGASWTTIDISSYNCNTFYAAVGSTNKANQENGHNSFIYQVFGATEQNGTYTLLAESTPITRTTTGEFKVDITGVKYLKLLIKCTDTGTHGYGNSVWANACIFNASADAYTVTAAAPATSVQQGKSIALTATVTKNGSERLTGQTITWAVAGGTMSGTKIDANGLLTVDAKEPVGTKLSVTASVTISGVTYTSAPVAITVDEAVSEYYHENAFTENTTGEYQTLASNVTYLSDVDWIESVNLNGKEAIRNGAWQNGAPIWIGGQKDTGGTNFVKGIGVQPQAPTATNNRGASWTTIDISNFNSDTFYAAVGSTNLMNQTDGVSSFIYQVYGATEKDGEFLLLAQSKPLTKTQTGEFKVDVKDMKVLKLVIKCTDTGNHTCGNSVWANACVYDSTADSYTVAVTAPAANVQQGKTLQFTASVTKNGKELTGQTVTWAVTGGKQAGTKISAKGLLTVDKKETADTQLSVTASIKVGKNTYTSTPVVITVDEAISDLYQPDAFTAHTSGKYQKLAKNVIWLSDVKWVESVNLNGAQAIRNGAWQNGSAIYIGGKSGGEITDGTKFDKGIGVQPQAPTADNNRGASWTTINVANLKCDTFYAAVGSTNKMNQNDGVNSFVYQVYGNTEKDGEFVLLAESKPLAKTETGEFKVSIKGIYELKLVIKCTDSGSHACGNSVWANACVYNKDGSNGNLSAMTGVTVTETPKQKKAYTAVKDGKYLTPTGQITFLSDIDWIESVNLDNKEAIRNGAWQNGAAIWLGGKSQETGGTKFVKGLGVQAQAPTADNNRGASWTTFDLTGLSADTFYAVIGCTNASNMENGHNSFIYQVYGATKENGKYTLLAQSDPITKTETGEFKVDITGYNFLKLQIKCTDTGTHGYGNSMWANACVFNSKTGSLAEGGAEVETTQPTVPTVVKPRPTLPADTGEETGGNGMIIGIAAIVLVVLVAAAVAVALILKKKKMQK